MLARCRALDIKSSQLRLAVPGRDKPGISTGATRLHSFTEVVPKLREAPVRQLFTWHGVAYTPATCFVGVKDSCLSQEAVSALRRLAFTDVRQRGR